MTTMTPQDCFSLLQAGGAIDLVDVRTPGEFDRYLAARGKAALNSYLGNANAT